ncbi:MAG: PAS domain S-box protein, partial [Kiritimatiellaeota bacterium]|nr:PAS domain S-box protein [Kiritimatiellota bacterium]
MRCSMHNCRPARLDYRILDCNPAFTSITGITRTRAVGALGSELYGIGQAPFLELYARVVQTGQPENIETFFAPLGKHFNLSALSYMPGRFATVTMDVTAHKQAETALRENERAHRTLLANLPGIAYRCQNQPDWPMDFISEGCRELLGYEVEQMLRGKPTFGSLIHPDDRRSVCDGVQASLQKGSVYNLEYRMRRADGSECWVLDRGRGVHDTDGKLLALEGIILDITARKAAEVALERSRGDWEHIFQAIGQPTAILDAEHNFLEANQALLQASGKTMAELRGLKCWHIFHGRDASKPVAECPMELALRSGKQEIAEVEVQTLGGIYLVSCTPVKNAAGQIEKIIHIATNITESKRLQQSFLQAQKMETVGKLAGGIAHDFNNILQTILGYSELLLKTTPPEDERHRDLEEIHRSGERAAGLTRQLLAFSRKQMLLPKVHDLNDIITNLGRMLIRLIGEDVDLKLELTPNIPRIRVDAGQIEQVLMNLAVNARDAMPKGGQLVIRTRSMVLTAEDLPMHPEGRPGQFVCLDVADNGGGMSLEVQAHIFEPFFTPKPQGKGTGLGLATVHGIIKQHEGWTTVYSESTLGTTFKIYLPAVTDADGAVDKILITPVPTGKNERILLIEDEPHVRRLAQLILSKNGYRVTAGGTCAEAQAAFDKHID